jgi:monoamine oxidase
MPVGDVLAERCEARLIASFTRRELIAGAGAFAAGAVLATPVATSARSLAGASAPRIAIVGGGLAGIRCAHDLWTGGGGRIASTVYEANPSRAGGRCWTLRDFFGSGLITEHGGAFINPEHHAIRRLASSLGLHEEVVNGGELSGLEEACLLDSGVYTHREATEDWEEVGYAVFHRALKEAATPAGLAYLDSLSVSEWLETTEIGLSSRFGKFMLADTVTENGGDPEDQSALDLIELVARKRDELDQTGNERFHVVGGNDQIISRMIEAVPAGTVQYGYQLVALRSGPGSSTTLVFDVSSSTVEVRADIVVLALPFSTLRFADLTKAGLSATKLNVIDTFGMGTNAKIHVELGHKTWPALGYSGSLYSEWEGFCCAWDDSVPLGPDASPALFLGFPGGRTGANFLSGEAHGPAPASDVAWFLSQVEQVYTGTLDAYTGLAYEDHWALDPWVRGAYSYPRVGQAARFIELAARTEGAIHFAGEHTSEEFEGFLNGGVETGERAAHEIRRALRN